MIAEKWVSAHGTIGFWPAKRTAPDTITVDNLGTPIHLECLRQQVKKAEGQPNLSLADFISPEKEDYLGAFAVTIKGIETHIERLTKENDDYDKIMLQALCDRLVEAFAELLHKKVRTDYWGYVKDEALDNEELIKEQYQGIRPAPGYPACPEHTEKYKLFDLLDVQQSIGIELTESLAMYPAASVCGWYFSHPKSQYFGIGKIMQDQADDYKKRKNWDDETAEKWLRPVLE